jgi:S1-C subfamily serine protease
MAIGMNVVHQKSPTASRLVLPNPSSGFSPAFGGGGSGSTSSSGSATAAQEVGVVDIDTVLGYQNGEAAGTGLILTSTGEVLTNNHVVDGATSVQVTVVSTGKSYRATVVGTDPTQDVAVLQLHGASGLQTVKTDSSAVSVGEQVTGVGNAGGVGGTPSAASGTVSATDQTITASDESGANSETLHGLIQDNADIQAGDSGGPLFNGANKVVGMDTAAESTPSGTTGVGYAIPIATALHVAQQIESGQASSTITIGNPAFLGVSMEPDGLGGSGAVVQDVLPGTPAAQSGLTAGDVITSVGGQAVSSASDLQSALSGYRPGQQVTITWTDGSGQSQSATVTLAQGPAN